MHFISFGKCTRDEFGESKVESTWNLFLNIAFEFETLN